MRRFLRWGSLLKASHEFPNGMAAQVSRDSHLLRHTVRAPQQAREKVSRPTRRELEPACDAGNSGGSRDDGESPDYRNEAGPQQQLWMSLVATILWRSTCRQYSNPAGGIVVEFAAAAAKPGTSGKPPRGYRMRAALARRRAKWAAVQ